MVKVRFIESCYFFSSQIFYNINDVAVMDKDQATKLYNRGLVDILNDDEYLDEETLKQEEKMIKEAQEKQEEIDEDISQEIKPLSDYKVAELREIAKEKGVEHSGLRKAELIEALEEVI